jgi:hypothetical protein
MQEWLTIEGVHQGIAGNGRACTAGGGGEWMVDAGLVPAHKVLHRLIRRKVDGMRRA